MDINMCICKYIYISVCVWDFTYIYNIYINETKNRFICDRMKFRSQTSDNMDR